MCGIIGSVATSNQTLFLLSALKKMEYRGYDSSGIALHINNKITVKKETGQVKQLTQNTNVSNLQSNCGIGHIRWATHGKPNKTNAHPHVSNNVALVHNGIIENYQELKEELTKQGFVFITNTDTEVIAHLMQSFLNKKHSPQTAFENTLKKLKGSYAIALIIEQEPNKIYAAKLNSPLVIATGENTNYVASDTLCLAGYAQKAIYLEDLNYAIISSKSINVYNLNGKEQEQKFKPITNKVQNSSKGSYSHFMLKEIYEQSDIFSNLIEEYIDKDKLCIKNINSTLNLSDFSQITLLGCGTAYNCCLLGQYYLETLAKINARAEISSEYRYRDIYYNKKGIVLAVSQSGETADTLAAIKKSLNNNQQVISILNNTESSIARLSNTILPINAGAEIGVASTKAFTAQSFVMICLAIFLGRQKNVLLAKDEQEIVKSLIQLPKLFNSILNNHENIKETAKYLQNKNSALFLGRHYSFPIALEGSLKLKEISYIHTEAYPSGEMKHGPIALIDSNLPVIFLLPSDELYEKSLSNMQEVFARNGQIILLSETQPKQKQHKYFIKVPHVHNTIKPILYTLPLQLLSYYTALYLKREIDKPRNLAKSVTVE